MRVAFQSHIRFARKVQTYSDAFSKFSGILYSIALSNGTLLFGNYIKSKMGILDFIRKNIFKPKTLIKNIFFEISIRFHKCCDRMEF